MFYYTYVLKCFSFNGETSLYIGHTDDLEKRLADHNSKTTRTTKKFQKIELIYYEACRNKASAIRREISLKTGFGRAYLKNMLKSALESGIS